MNHFSTLKQDSFKQNKHFFSWMPRPKRLLAIAVTCAFFGGMPVANAQEKVPDPVRHFLNALLKKWKMKVNAEKVQRTAEGYELYNITFSKNKESKETPIKKKYFISGAFIARATLKGVSQSNGFTKYEHIKMEQVLYHIKRSDGETVMISAPREDKYNVSILHSDSAKSPLEKRIAGAMLTEKSITPRIDILWSNGFSLVAHDVRQAWKGNRRTGEGNSEASLGGLAISARDLALLDPAFSVWMEMLGLEKTKLSGVLRSQNQWQSDQRLHINTLMQLTIEKAGTLELELNDLAFPTTFMNLFENQKVSGNETTTSQSTSSLSLKNPQISSALNQLSLQRVRIKWKDAGLTRRYLELQKSGAFKDLQIPGTNGTQNVRSLDEILRNILGEPYQRASDAFQKDPKNIQIEIRGRNGAPISAPMLLALALAPQALASMLQIDVRANMPE